MAAEILVVRTVVQPPTGTGKDCFHFFAKRPTKAAKALVAEGYLYDVGCEFSAQFVRDNPGWTAVGCEDDAHSYSNADLPERVRKHAGGRA